jgi:hypothetical protein
LYLLCQDSDPRHADRQPMIGGYFWLALQGERDARTKFLRERV